MIEFQIIGQSIQRTDNEKVITYATSLQAKFNFVSLDDWSGKTLTAFFTDSSGKAYKMLLDNTYTCVVPPEVLKNGGRYFYVGVAAGDNITTNKAQVYTFDSCYESGATISEPTSDIYTQIMNKLDNIGSGGSGGGGTGSSTASGITYTNENLGSVNTVQAALDAIAAKVYYVAPAITSFTITPSTTTYELGTVINSLTFNWTVNKTPTSQSLTDISVTAATRTATYSKALSSNKTFTLFVDDGTQSANKSITISFLPKVYYGVSTIPTTIDTNFILGLANNKLSNTKNGTYNFTTGANQYAYIAYPKSYGTASCKIGGFDTELDLSATVSHTNASGRTQDYYVYRTTQANLGSFSMVLS